MKYILAFLILSGYNVLKAQPPKGAANPGDSYGSTIPNPAALPMLSSEDLVKRLPSDSKDTLEIILTGKVKDACSSKGCWLTLELPNQQELMMKMQDYAFFVPIAIIGKQIEAFGKVYIKTVSVVDLQHYAQDAGKSKAEINKIKTPETQYRFVAKGIRVKSL